MTEPLHDRVVEALKHQYEVEGEIGRGGMSVVYRARDVRLGRQVAVKVLPPELAYDPAVRARFTREAQTAAQLAHPHIVPIYDVGEREGIAYLVMAYVEGGNLATRLAQEPRQEIGEVTRLLCEIAGALDYAHTRGVVHRDIKPDNILLDRDSQRAMVTDFGIARAMEANTRLTATGNAVGTPAYMSPEQAVGEREIDGRSDLYSLGILGYQMVTGRLPFTAANPMALLLKHVGEKARPIAELRPETPPALREAIDRAMMKEAVDRWPTGAALRTALGAGGDRRPETGYRSPPVPVSPRTSDAIREPLPPSMPSPKGALVMEPAHLAGLTPEQRADLRLWHGRITLMERIKGLRGYAGLTIGATFMSMAALAGVEEIPPLIMVPIIPIMMWPKLWRRGKSLRAMGVKLRRALLMPRAKWVIPAPAPVPGEAQLEKLVPRHVLQGPHGAIIRRAAEDKLAILASLTTLPKADRSQLPDVEPTVNALVDRVAHLAKALDRLDQGVDNRLMQEIDLGLAGARADDQTPEGQRRLALLERQRATLESLSRRRAELASQLENAGLALRSLRLDLIKLRSSGLQSAIADISTATQEARALSRDIGHVLDAASEVRDL